MIDNIARIILIIILILETYYFKLIIIMYGINKFQVSSISTQPSNNDAETLPIALTVGETSPQMQVST